MRRKGAWALALLVCLLLPAASVRAEEEIQQTIEVDVSAMQDAADEAGAALDVSGLIADIVRGEGGAAVQQLIDFARQVVEEELGGFRTRLILLIGPALLWAVNRYLLGSGELGETAGLVCFVCGAGVLLGMVREYMTLTQDTLRRISSLTTQFFAILSGLKSASGASGMANALSPVVTLLGGALSVFLERAVRVLGVGVAVTAVAGNLTGRISLQSLFRLLGSAGNWLMGSIMAAFVTLISFGGVVGSAQSGITMKAAKYAVGTLLPVVGGDVAGTMDVMTASASAVCGAAGVTGVIVMLLICLRPVVRLLGGMLCCMLACALTEPVADGPLRRCMEQVSQVVRLLLVASCVGAVLFIVLAGVVCAG